MLDNPSRLGERELVRRARDLDEEALSALFGVYYPKIFRYGMGHLRDVQTSEDFASEVMLKVLNAVPAYRFKGPPFSAWVFRIARNRLIDLMRRDSRRPRFDLSESMASSQIEPDIAVERALTRSEVLLALQHLNDRQALVIALRYFHELDTASIAAVLGASRCSVKSIQHRALKSLRRIMCPEVSTPVGNGAAETAWRGGHRGFAR